MPLLYARSNSGRRRTRLVRRSRSVTGGSGRLAFVGHRQPLAALRPATLEHDAAVFGRHADPEPMRLLSTPGVGLVSTLPLHAVLYEKSGRSVPGRTSNTSGRIEARQIERPHLSSDHPSVLTNWDFGIAVCYSPQFASRRLPRLPGRCSVLSPRFPQLWKKLWKRALLQLSLEK